MRNRIPHLTVYGRAYCHLCDDMIAALTALQARHGFTFDVIDVDADPALEARYDERVPVLAHRGVEICHHVLSIADLLTSLATARGCGSGSR